MNGVDENAVAEWKDSIGRKHVQHQNLELQSLRRFALAVGGDPDKPEAATPLGHWSFFLPDPQDGELDHDGHPHRGGFMPAIALPRRMFAAATIEFVAPLIIGDAAELHNSIVDVTHKTGRSGDLVFVEVERLLSQQDSVRVRERKSFVYRDLGAPTLLPEAVAEPIEGEVWTPTEPNLFRFSAATFNSHRIHYDLPYSRNVEGYPALIVHGPFTAAKLAELAGRDGPLASFSFRAQVPLFLGQPIYMQKNNDDEVCAVRCDGAIAMTAKVTYV